MVFCTAVFVALKNWLLMPTSMDVTKSSLASQRCKMYKNPLKMVGSTIEFSGFGKNTLAYMRKLEPGEMITDMAGGETFDQGVPMWGLFGADGEPLAVSDDRAWIIDNAHERELLPVSRH